MGKLYYMQWNTGDWRKDPGVRSLSPESRAFWREAIDILFDAEIRGVHTATIEGWSSATGCPVEWVRLFIEENGVYRVADVINSDAYVTLTCRRIVRDEIKRGQGAERTKRWRAKRQDEEDVTEGDEDVLTSNMYPLGSPPQEGESEGEEYPSFDENDPAYQVATRLLEAIIRRKSNFKKPGPDTFNRWVTEASRMLRLDSRELPIVLAVIDWLPTAPVNGSFCWSDSILSVSKLRKQFDQLEIAMDRSRSTQNDTRDPIQKYRDEARGR